MKFDRENEFDRIMEEIFPLSIPASYIKAIVVKMKNGSVVNLSGEDLLNPLPMSGDFSWSEVAKNFEAIDDVEVLVDIPELRDSVIKNVKSILAKHFDNYKGDDND